MRELTVTIYPARVEEELVTYGYKPTPERVEKVMKTIEQSAFTDIDQWIDGAIEHLGEPDSNGEYGLGEQDG